VKKFKKITMNTAKLMISATVLEMKIPKLLHCFSNRRKNDKGRGVVRSTLRGSTATLSGDISVGGSKQSACQRKKIKGNIDYE
jgi:hypothetical protein